MFVVFLYFCSMRIELQDLMPVPLREQHTHKPQQSEVWLQRVALEQGKNYAIQAQSGRGKSTLLHILYGSRQDYVGKVFFEKTPIQRYKPQDWATLRQQKIGIVFQDLRLFLHLTAEDNILAKTYLAYPKPDKEKIYHMADHLQIKHLLESKKNAGLFSYGERQRIAILRALMSPFEWLLLDEPFSHLDAENVQRASELIQQTCQAQGAGYIIASLGYDYPLTFDKVLTL